jgi:hypothetical protein
MVDLALWAPLLKPLRGFWRRELFRRLSHPITTNVRLHNRQHMQPGMLWGTLLPQES